MTKFFVLFYLLIYQAAFASSINVNLESQTNRLKVDEIFESQNKYLEYQNINFCKLKELTEILEDLVTNLGLNKAQDIESIYTKDHLVDRAIVLIGVLRNASIDIPFIPGEEYRDDQRLFGGFPISTATGAYTEDRLCKRAGTYGACVIVSKGSKCYHHSLRGC